jgi:coenzyme Q-binding protein COQ10
MPRHFEQRVLPYSPDQMFALVADIEQYPAFLPWCRSVCLREKSGNAVTADLDVGTSHFHDRFTSHVTFERPCRITVAYGGGALAYLANEWRFAPLAGGGCEVSFYLDFGLRSSLQGALANIVFNKAFKKMAQAFELRAKEIYG